MKAPGPFVLLLALAIGLGGWSFAPQASAPGGTGEMTAMTEAPATFGDRGEMVDCEACSPIALAGAACEYACPPPQFIAPPLSEVAFALSGGKAPLLSSQLANGLTIAPSPPPPRSSNFA